VLGYTVQKSGAQRSAARPIEASKGAVGYVRNTSTRDVQSVATNFRFGSEGDIQTDPPPACKIN